MMWSYVQYKRIGQQVKEEIKRKKALQNNEKEHSKLELGKSPSLEPTRAVPLASARSAPIQEPQEERIFVRISGDDDPLDPRNWPLISRCKNIAILSLLIFVQAWAGAAESMANTEASEAFHVGKTTETLSTAMYLFGVGSGSLFAGPLSETVGKNPTYLVSTLCYLVFVAGSALTSTFGGQVVCRYFVGLFSSATLAINGSSVRDQFRPVKRAFVFPVIAWANVARIDQQSPFFKPY
jgi:MFS transporter, DHA1 family, multidrug resistance protein